MKRLALLWLASLAVVALIASTLTLAQAPQDNARVISGDGLGFRVEGLDSLGNPTGPLVIRVDGEWVETAFSGGFRRLQ